LVAAAAPNKRRTATSGSERQRKEERHAALVLNGRKLGRMSYNIPNVEMNLRCSRSGRSGRSGWRMQPTGSYPRRVVGGSATFFFILGEDGLPEPLRWFVKRACLIAFSPVRFNCRGPKKESVPPASARPGGRLGGRPVVATFRTQLPFRGPAAPALHRMPFCCTGRRIGFRTESDPGPPVDHLTHLRARRGGGSDGGASWRICPRGGCFLPNETLPREIRNHFICFRVNFFGREGPNRKKTSTSSAQKAEPKRGKRRPKRKRMKRGEWKRKKGKGGNVVCHIWFLLVHV
jgi:hypothetical protein